MHQTDVSRDRSVNGFSFWAFFINAAADDQSWRDTHNYSCLAYFLFQAGKIAQRDIWNSTHPSPGPDLSCAQFKNKPVQEMMFPLWELTQVTKFLPQMSNCEHQRSIRQQLLLWKDCPHMKNSGFKYPFRVWLDLNNIKHVWEMLWLCLNDNVLQSSHVTRNYKRIG